MDGVPFKDWSTDFIEVSVYFLGLAIGTNSGFKFNHRIGQSIFFVLNFQVVRRIRNSGVSDLRTCSQCSREAWFLFHEPLLLQKKIVRTLRSFYKDALLL